MITCVALTLTGTMLSLLVLNPTMFGIFTENLICPFMFYELGRGVIQLFIRCYVTTKTVPLPLEYLSKTSYLWHHLVISTDKRTILNFCRKTLLFTLFTVFQNTVLPFEIKNNVSLKLHTEGIKKLCQKYIPCQFGNNVNTVFCGPSGMSQSRESKMLCSYTL